jgi:hypothetical protein
MSADGRRQRLSWVHQFCSGSQHPEQVDLPGHVKPPTVVDASFRRGLYVVLDDGLEADISPPFALPPVRDRLYLQLDAKSGHLRRSWFVDAPGADTDSIEGYGTVIADGMELIAALPGGEVRRWLLEDGSPLPCGIPVFDGRMFLVSPDEQSVLCGRVVLGMDGSPRFRLDDHARCAIWDPIGNFLMTGDDSGIDFWALGIPRPFLSLPVKDGVLAMAWQADGGLLAIGRGGIWRFEAMTGPR